MRITIEPETDEENGKHERVVYEQVYEFAITGSWMRGDVVPTPIHHTHGDTYSLYGRLAELQERLRRHHDGNAGAE